MEKAFLQSKISKATTKKRKEDNSEEPKVKVRARHSLIGKEMQVVPNVQTLSNNAGLDDYSYEGKAEEEDDAK